MGDLRANTDVMRNGVGTISTSADTIAQVANRIGNLKNHLGSAYQGQLRDKVEPILSQAVGEGNRLQGQSGQFSGSLDSLAGQIDAVMQQRGMAVIGAPVTTVSGSPVGKLFGRASQLVTGFVAAILTGIGIRTAPPVTIIPSKPAPTPTNPPAGLDRSKIIDRTTKTPLYNPNTKTGNYSKGRGGAIDSIVIHGTGGSTATGAISTLQNPSKTVSAHYVVDKDGTIYQLVKEEDTAYHATWFNSRSIGIEVVQAKLEKPTDGNYYEPYTPEQLAATKELVLDISRRYGIPPESILSHQQVDKMAKDSGLLKPNWSGKVDGGESLEELRNYVK